MRRLAAALIAAFAAACAGGKPAAPPAAGPAPAPVAHHVAGAIAVLQVDTGAGEQSLEGDFELCAGGGSDATALIGKPVTYTTRRANLPAASCQGKADCTDSDEVDLVVSITAAP
jgi:hypothetical protein